MLNAPTEKGRETNCTKMFRNEMPNPAQLYSDIKQRLASSSVSLTCLFSEIQTPKYPDFICLNIVVYPIILVLIETCFNTISAEKSENRRRISQFHSGPCCRPNVTLSSKILRHAFICI
jgi:ATP/ADP translocase